MAAEGFEKFTEVPLEFFKDGSAFVRKCQKPDRKGMCYESRKQTCHAWLPLRTD